MQTVQRKPIHGRTRAARTWTTTGRTTDVSRLTASSRASRICIESSHKRDRTTLAVLKFPKRVIYKFEGSADDSIPWTQLYRSLYIGAWQGARVLGISHIGRSTNRPQDLAQDYRIKTANKAIRNFEIRAPSWRVTFALRALTFNSIFSLKPKLEIMADIGGDFGGGIGTLSS